MPKKKKYKKGGYLEGASHKNGGIPIEVEGGEFIVKKDSVNDDTLPMLRSRITTFESVKNELASDAYKSFRTPELNQFLVDKQKREQEERRLP